MLKEIASVNHNPDAPELRVGGLARLSSCDWPGMLAATIFCQGCAWDCPYCHNPHLRPLRGENPMPWSTVLQFLKRRRGLLDGVVFSGGEPTLQRALPEAIAAVRALGFKVALHTAGMIPERFTEVLPQVDWVGFDIKAPFQASLQAPFQAYARITGRQQSGEAALRSLRLLLASGKTYELRTTFAPGLLSEEDLTAIRSELLALGATQYAVQHFRPVGAVARRVADLLGASHRALPETFGLGFERFTIR